MATRKASSKQYEAHDMELVWQWIQKANRKKVDKCRIDQVVRKKFPVFLEHIEQDRRNPVHHGPRRGIQNYLGRHVGLGPAWPRLVVHRSTNHLQVWP